MHCKTIKFSTSGCLVYIFILPPPSLSPCLTGSSLVHRTCQYLLNVDPSVFWPFWSQPDWYFLKFLFICVALGIEPRGTLPWATSQPFLFTYFYFATGILKLLRLPSNLWSSCTSLLSCWDYRRVLLHPTNLTDLMGGRVA